MKTIMDLRTDLDNKLVTSEELFKKSNELAHKYQDEFNPFVTIKKKKVIHYLMEYLMH